MALPGWYNENANRAYPFLPDTVGLPASGPLALGNMAHSAIVDAGFILGPRSGFNVLAHKVWLARLRRQGGSFFFDFASDAPGLAGVFLTFTRSVSGEKYLSEQADSGEEGLSARSLSGSSSSVTALLCDEPLWSGFLVTGDLAELGLLLAVNGMLLAAAGECIIEPGLLQNLADSYVTQLALANDDRTRTDAPEECEEVIFPYPVGLTYASALCIAGEVRFKAGYNAVIRSGDGSITFGAAVAAGAGQPCAPVKLFVDERPPEGSNLLEGGLSCNQVLHSVNGLGGRELSFIAGQGVSITPAPEENKVIIDVNLDGLAIQYTVSAVSESC